MIIPVWLRGVVVLRPTEEYRDTDHYVFLLGIGTDVAQAWPIVAHIPIRPVVKLLKIPPRFLIKSERPGCHSPPWGHIRVHISPTRFDNGAVFLLPRRDEGPNVNSTNATRRTFVQPLPMIDICVLKNAMCTAIADQED